MMGNREIRQEAWSKIVRTRWLWRLATVAMLLNALGQTAMALLASSFTRLGITTWTEFCKAKFAAAQQDLGYCVPSVSVVWQMTGASAFEMFVTYLFSAIFSLGIAAATLKALGDEEIGWFKNSLEGFCRPLEAAWLLFLINLKIALWSLLLLVPGIIAMYRYRQAWYLKAQNPDWTAARCIAESCRIMEGFKMQAFMLDVSFLGWLLLSGVGIGCALLVENALAGVLSVSGAVFVLCYFFSARAVFYREVCRANGRGDE